MDDIFIAIIQKFLDYAVTKNEATEHEQVLVSIGRGLLELSFGVYFIEEIFISALEFSPDFKLCLTEEELDYIQSDAVYIPIDYLRAIATRFRHICFEGDLEYLEECSD